MHIDKCGFMFCGIVTNCGFSFLCCCCCCCWACGFRFLLLLLLRLWLARASTGGTVRAKNNSVARRMRKTTPTSLSKPKFNLPQTCFKWWAVFFFFLAPFELNKYIIVCVFLVLFHHQRHLEAGSYLLLFTYLDLFLLLASSVLYVLWGQFLIYLFLMVLWIFFFYFCFVHLLFLF